MLQVKKPTACKRKAGGSPKDKERRLNKLTLQKEEGGSSDYEIKDEGKVHVRDESTVARKFPKTKIILDERHFVQIRTVSLKSKGITYVQLFIGREASKPEPGKKQGKTFQMGLPLRCIQPLLRALKFLTEQEEKAAAL